MRLLIIEDEVALATTLADALHDDGWVVDLAHDGLTGLGLATHGGHDVIVLDIMLPEMHGYDVLRRLRGIGVRTPVLMLSAKDGEYDQTDAFDFGADDYVTKPFSTLILKARLQALLRRGAGGVGTSLVVGDLSLDPSAKRVTRGSHEITLTPREFALLAHLMRNAGSVCTKADILDHVWDSDYPGADNVVEVYVGYLRRKVDHPFGRASIITMRGMGYRVIDDRGSPTG